MYKDVYGVLAVLGEEGAPVVFPEVEVALGQHVHLKLVIQLGAGLDQQAGVGCTGFG